MHVKKLKEIEDARFYMYLACTRRHYNVVLTS